MDAALKEIASSTSREFPILVTGEGKQIEVSAAKEWIAAIAAKDKDAVIIVRWQGSAFSIPAAALPAGTDIRIVIGAPEPGVTDAWTKLLQEEGFIPVAAPLTFKVEGKNTTGAYGEITDFGNNLLSHTFIVKGSDIHKAQTAGVVYLPETGELRPVPVLFTDNADGTVTVDLKRKGNSVYGLVETTVSFTDSLAAWAQQDAWQAAAKLIVTSDAGGKFDGARELNRAEVTSLIVRALGILPDRSAAGTAFKDVAAESAYAADIAAAKEAGLINGRGSGLFHPTASVTREEAAVILAKALAYAGISARTDSNALNRFTDRNKVSGYAVSSVALLVERGIMNGVSASRLAPQATVTKEQATVLIMKTLRSAGLSD
ncbi:S-layer homology domain-containing protein [Paenibacillus glycanilyticus]|uniref:S-layer homology domain-containing protein n=1 Tax=Paenibacillus glycanilyticus TaxID=126569 RepID=UPI00203A3CEB|nr:S-layer homology domain-containing protein [Paenibacillus glycanilyticus]MCM3626896.1 S-layer homology domain-containing protein [Paenibacillus glycanilyticus]